MPVITKFKLNICEPYSIKYPMPALDVKNSPIITPIKHIEILIFKVFKIIFLFSGITTFINVLIFDALKVLNNFIFNLSVFSKPLYIVCMLTIIEISMAIVIIPLVLAPIHIIIIGPNATLGSEFNTVKYGSHIFDKVLKLYNIIEIIKDKIVVIINDINVSLVVTQI